MFVSSFYFFLFISAFLIQSQVVCLHVYRTLNTTTPVISQIILTFHTGSLAWFRVEEYSGLTGRKGTTVVSVTRVLWFCVASQTSRRKRARDSISSHLWCQSSAGRHSSHTTSSHTTSTLQIQHTQKYMSTHGL